MKDQILIADDNPNVLSALTYLFETENYNVSAAHTPNEVIRKVKTTSFDLLLMDLNYSKGTTSGKEGLNLIRELRNLDEKLPIIVMTAWGSIETAVSVIKGGAGDFIQKPWDNDRLLSITSNQIRMRKSETQSMKLEEENQILRKQLNAVHKGKIYHSQIMDELIDQVEQVAQSNASILLTGENGTGKSFLAHQIHQLSPRKTYPLISVNMGSISESLFESEMFGHVKGAFTDARENRIGRFELADRGSIFLDEIGNTPYSQQAKLLRVLEDHNFEKVGASRTQETDCRVISATNCDLDVAVKAGEFRKDLLYRINTITIRVPSLHERRDDIIPLAEFFLEDQKMKYSKAHLTLDDSAIVALAEYPWPGNVRELSHVMERATIVCTKERITDRDLGLIKGTSNSAMPTLDILENPNLTLVDLEKMIIYERMKIYRGNNRETAESLGLSRSAFYRHLKKHEL